MTKSKVDRAKRPSDAQPSTSTVVDSECKRPRPLIGYPGGKSRVACEIIKHFPAHEKYVEPFGGGLSVFLAKGPSKHDVVADKSREVVAAYHATKSGVHCRRTVSSQRAERHLVAENSQDPCDIVARRAGSFAKKGLHPNRAADYPIKVDWPSKEIAGRLERVRVESGDYKETMERHDGPDVLHYLDPPYPGSGDYGPGLNNVDPHEVKGTALAVRGSVAISYPDTSSIRKIFCRPRSNFKCHRIRTPVFGTGRGFAGYRRDLLIIKAREPKPDSGPVSSERS